MQYPDYKPGLESPPLSDEELQALDELLAGLPAAGAMNIEQLDGYLTMLAEAERKRRAEHLDERLTVQRCSFLDLEPVAGLRTTWGSLIFKDHIPEADDLTVSNIRVAGGIPFCKTNSPEFGAGANTTNRVYGATGAKGEENENVRAVSRESIEAGELGVSKLTKKILALRGPSS